MVRDGTNELPMRHGSSAGWFMGNRASASCDVGLFVRTVGTTLLAVELCSSVHVRMLVQNGRSEHGVLYLTAVWDDWREQEYRQGTIDTDPVDDLFCVRECCRPPLLSYLVPEL
jgi:hypothetical protein